MYDKSVHRRGWMHNNIISQRKLTTNIYLSGSTLEFDEDCWSKSDA